MTESMTPERFKELWETYSPWSGLHGIELQAAKDMIESLTALIVEMARAEQVEHTADCVYRASGLQHWRDACDKCRRTPADWQREAWVKMLGRTPE